MSNASNAAVLTLATVEVDLTLDHVGQPADATPKKEARFRNEWIFCSTTKRIHRLDG